MLDIVYSPCTSISPSFSVPILYCQAGMPKIALLWLPHDLNSANDMHFYVTWKGNGGGCSSFPGEFGVKQFLGYMWADSFWTHIPVYLPSLWCREALMRYSQFPRFCVILAVSDLWIKMAVICNLETRNLALTLWLLFLLPF